MTVNEIWLIRHGETDWNAAQKIQGWSDIPLNAEGREQAKVIARWFQGIEVHEVRASDLERAFETAKPIADALNCALFADERLRERGMGAAEGQHRSLLRDRFLMDFEDAEPLADVHARIQDLLSELAAKPDLGRVVCVTHGGWIRNLLSLLGIEDIPPIRNTSITKLNFEDDTWRVVEIGAVPHLAELDRMPTER